MIIWKTFCRFFLSLLTTLVVENSQSFTGIFFMFLEIQLDQTCKAFNTLFGSQWKDRESSFQVRQILELFFHTSCSNVMLILCQRCQSYKNCPKNQIWMGPGQLTSKKLLPKAITHQIFKTNSSFHLKKDTAAKVKFPFFGSFC